MKKISIKFILCSLIFSLSIISGSIFVNHKENYKLCNNSFYGYNVDYTTTTDENHLTTIDLNHDYTSTLPSSYDLRDKIEIKVEDQKQYGICYAYGT